MKKEVKKKNRKVNKKILIILPIILILFIILGCCCLLLNNTKKEEISLNFTSGIEKLRKIDSKGVYKIGWLQVQGTNIDLPVLYAAAIENEYDYSFSWLSPNYVTGENREVLLGHNVVNVSNKPMLPNKDLKDFEELMAFVYYDFAKENLYIQYTQNGKDDIYLIYAVGFTDYEYDYSSGYGYSDKEEIDNYIKETRKNSIYDYDIDVDSSDTLIQLKTCTRMFGIGKNQQFVIDARKLRKNEKTIKYDVKTSEMFDKLDLKGEKDKKTF